jgi:molybdopterin-guanine dinucleotide biosynthesis protein A
MIELNDITAVVLAGGRGSRMGGVDKGLQNFNGTPLALHAALKIGLQVGQVLINANRNLSAYEAFGCEVVPDTDADFSGPLSGFMVGLERCTTPYLLTLPCDSPNFPSDLVSRLAAGFGVDTAAANVEIVMAAQGGRTEPVFCLIKTELLESLHQFMRAGGRKIDAWTAQHNTVMVNFDEPQYTGAFANANTLEELANLA